MRILMLTQSYAPIVGGVERVVEDLSVELARRGHEVAVATLRQGQCAPETAAGDVPVYHLGSAAYRLPGVRFDQERRHAPPAPDPETAVALRRIVRRHRPDVVHAHNWLVHSYLPLDRRSGPALALSMHDYGLLCATKRFLNRGAPCSGPAMLKCVRCAGDFYESPVKGGAVAVATRVMEVPLRRRVDIYLPVSSSVRDACRLGPGDLSRVIPNFIRALPPAPEGPAPELAALPSRPFILYFGDVTADKGADLLVAAYRRLENPPPLVLAGRLFLPELASVPGVTALGPLPHALAMEVLRRSLFTVVPSVLPEAFGLVALESAAAGKPTIASDIGGLGDVVAAERTGLLVPPGDGDGLLAALRRLLADPALRERLGAAARARAAEFSPDAVVPRYEEAYEAAIASRRARAGR